MGFPRFRFTLNNSTAGSLVISEPGGWDEAVLKIERNQEFHSLVEFYDQPLTFYGQSSEGNGGLDYIREIERSQGPDAQITILIEISQDDGDSYETVFDGLIDITSCKEIDFYKAEYGIIRNDFWQKFMNRKGIPVNLGASVDLDGDPVTPYTADTITLTNQKIRQYFERQTGYSFSEASAAALISSPPALTSYLTFRNIANQDEIKERFEYGNEISSIDPRTSEKYLFKIEENGSYTIDASIRYQMTGAFGFTWTINWWIAINHRGVVTSTQIGTSQSGTGGFSDDGARVISKVADLISGDEIYIFGILTVDVAAGQFTYSPDWLDGGGMVYTTLVVTADTTYIDTTTEAYQIHDAANSIVSKLTGVDAPVISDYLAGDYGCGGNYALTRGLNIRGYTFAEKPFTMSFDAWWAGANPIFNIGLGYSGDALEIEPKSEFYDQVPVVNLDYVNFIERSYNTPIIFKTVEVGYEKWSAESDSGIDDPQSKRIFRTRFKTVGEDLRILSKFYAASLGIEQTRRNRKEQGKDWRLDGDIFIIALKKVNLTQPETGSDFSSVTGLLNSNTRYNIRISATRNLNRWLSFINGCLKWYTTNDDLVFSSGEGNYDMISTLAVTDCEGTGIAVDENADIDQGAGHDFLFVPIVYEFDHPLTWAQYNAIRSYRKKAIGVSRTNSGHVPCFIMNLEYQITKGKAKFTVLLGQSEPI